MTDTAQDVDPTTATQPTNVEGVSADKRNALWARCDAFENAIVERLQKLESSVSERMERLESSFKERVDKLEGSVNEQLEHMDTNIAGLILTGEYDCAVRPH